MWSDAQRKRTYQCWQDMRQRCINPKNHNFRNYGGRGIAVDPRWCSFALFVEDMGLKPDGLTLERIDNSLGYGPHNCRWASRSEQRRNQRGNVNIAIHGETRTLEEWARHFGLHPETVRTRRRLGWAPDRLFIPVDKRFSVCRKPAMSSLAQPGKRKEGG